MAALSSSESVVSHWNSSAEFNGGAVGIAHIWNPDQFDVLVAFEDSFSALVDEERVAGLYSTLQPYIIRRQKNRYRKKLVPTKT